MKPVFFSFWLLVIQASHLRTHRRAALVTTAACVLRRKVPRHLQPYLEVPCVTGAHVHQLRMSRSFPQLKGKEKCSLTMKNVKNQKYLVNSTHDRYDLTYTWEPSNLGLPKKQHLLCMFEPKDLSSLNCNQILCSCLFSYMRNSHMKKF